jgi:hypothetical protein
MPARFSGVGALQMKKLFAVPWLSAPCRTLLTFVMALVLVLSALTVLKISSRAKQKTPVDELTTGSIQRSSAIGGSEAKNRMASYLDSGMSQPPARQLQSNLAVQGPVPLPRPRPKLK